MSKLVFFLPTPSALCLRHRKSGGGFLGMDECERLIQFLTPAGLYWKSMVIHRVAMLSQNLWKALIAGPQSEDTMWDVLTTEGNLDAEQLEPIKTCYYKQMKPSVSAIQLVVLRAMFEVRHEQGD